MLKINEKEFIKRVADAGFKRAHLNEKFDLVVLNENEIPAKFLNAFKDSCTNFVGGGKGTFYLIAKRKSNETISLEDAIAKFTKFIKSTILCDKDFQEDISKFVAFATVTGDNKINEAEESNQDNNSEENKESEEQADSVENTAQSEKLFVAIGIRLY